MLQPESQELLNDIQASISRSILRSDGKTVLPSIAGVKEPFHITVPKINQTRNSALTRAYMEMMYSGNLIEDQIRMIVNYRSHHHDLILGMPTAYAFKTGILAGFLSYGYSMA